MGDGLIGTLERRGILSILADFGMIFSHRFTHRYTMTEEKNCQQLGRREDGWYRLPKEHREANSKI